MASIQELLSNPDIRRRLERRSEQSTIGFKAKSMWGLAARQGPLHRVQR